MILFCLGIVSPLLTTLVQSAALPQTFMPCHKYSSDFLECLGNSIKTAVNSLKEDIPALKLKNLEPYYLPAAFLDKGVAVDVQQNYTDIYIHGLTAVQNVKVSKADMKIFHLEFNTFHPYLRWQANYKAAGKLLMLPIYGEGAANLTLHNTTGTHKIAGELFTKKGTTFAKCTSYGFIFDAMYVEPYFENLFNGNKMLSETMHQVMQDNWKEIFNDIKGGYEVVLGEVLKNYATQVFGRVPYKDIFLD